jgi:hypothetical protein
VLLKSVLDTFVKDLGGEAIKSGLMVSCHTSTAIFLHIKSYSHARLLL